MLVARNENLSAISFQSLAEAMPKDDQQCDKTYILYRTIDIYLNVWKFEVGLKEKIYGLAQLLNMCAMVMTVQPKE